MLDWLQKQRLRLEAELAESELRWCFSPLLYLGRRQLAPLLREQARGAVLDVGCGHMPYLPYLDTAAITAYDGYDIEQRSPKTRYIGNAEDMAMIESASYDTVLSLFSLEHVARPWIALAEMRRVCKPGGTIIVAVPHLSRLHEEPHDYFRFTHYGLRALGDAVGLETVRIEPMGGLFAFLGHQVSTIGVCVFWSVPIVKWIAFWSNYWLTVRLCVTLDRLLRTDRKYAANYIAVFRAP